MSQYDITIIGGGPGGYIAAIRAAQLGAKVALIEKDKVGGTCLNRGCIPTKAIIACTDLFEKIKRAENFGINTGTASIDLVKVIERKDKIVEKSVKGVEFLLQKNKIEIIYGEGIAKEPGLTKVGSRDVQSQATILATGSSPTQLPGLEFDGKKFISSAQALQLKQIPKQINIIGGGVIGVEFASIFSAMGSSVTIYELLPDILTGVDQEIVAYIKRVFKRRKVNILTDTKFIADKAAEVNLVCVGRSPSLAGLENLKLDMVGKQIKVNEKMETSLTNVYAAGDLVSKKMLAHAAYEQGVIAAENALGGKRTFNYDYVPAAIFTHPEIASVGKLEGKTGKFNYAAMGIAQAKGETEGFVKVVADDSGKLLGVHIIGPDATNLIGAAAIALRNGLTVEQLAETFQAHPTYMEGLEEAALSVLKRSLHQIN